MRFLVRLVLVEVVMLGLVVAISRANGSRREPAPTRGPVHRIAEVTYRQAVTLEVGGSRTTDAPIRHVDGGGRRLGAQDRAAALAPLIQDAILRIEGLYDPTRIGLLGPSLRMQVRPGTAVMHDVFGERWSRPSTEANLHRRVVYIAHTWLAEAGPAGCEDFWIDRRSEAAVALDALTPVECRALSLAGPTAGDPLAPLVAARLDLPVFAAPYPGNRLTRAQLFAEQQARGQVTVQNRWFRHRATIDARSPALSTERPGAHRLSSN